MISEHMRFDIDWASLCGPVARIVWGDPTTETSMELRWGTHGARKVDLGKGTWYDHEDKTGGGTIDLVPGIDTAEKVRWLQSHGLVSGSWPRTSERQDKAPPPWMRPIATTYDYTDEAGTLLFEVVRFDDGFEPRFMQRRGRKGWGLGDARRVLYRLPEVVAAIAARQPVFVVEGEKDADNLRAASVVATTNPMGAGNWKAAYSEMLRGADVVLVGDNDEAGRKHVAQVASALHGIASRLRVFDLAKAWPECPAKGDVSDWLEAGHTAAELETLVAALPNWMPKEQPQRTAETPSVVNVVSVVWPVMADAAYHGLAGDVVRIIGPHSEADPVALLVQLLIAAGNLMGRTAYYQVEGDRHYANIFSVMVGDSAKARRAPHGAVFVFWPPLLIQSGWATG
jgi:hypothetical protein